MLVAMISHIDRESLTSCNLVSAFIPCLFESNLQSRLHCMRQNYKKQKQTKMHQESHVQIPSGPKYLTKICQDS